MPGESKVISQYFDLTVFVLTTFQCNNKQKVTESAFSPTVTYTYSNWYNTHSKEAGPNNEGKEYRGSALNRLQDVLQQKHQERETLHVYRGHGKVDKWKCFQGRSTYAQEM